MSLLRETDRKGGVEIEPVLLPLKEILCCVELTEGGDLQKGRCRERTCLVTTEGDTDV